jgi:CID domain
MRKLEGSQVSIVDTSDTLLRTAQYDHTLVNFIVQLWSRLLSRSHKSKKVAYVYLANDVIQKTLAQNNKIYQKAFEPILKPSLTVLFEQQLNRSSEPSNQTIKIDILKVIQLWRSRQIYPPDDMIALKEHLMKVGKISEEDIAPGGAGQYRPIGQGVINPE